MPLLFGAHRFIRLVNCPHHMGRFPAHSLLARANLLLRSGCAFLRRATGLGVLPENSPLAAPEQARNRLTAAARIVGENRSKRLSRASYGGARGTSILLMAE